MINYFCTAVAKTYINKKLICAINFLSLNKARILVYHKNGNTIETKPFMFYDIELPPPTTSTVGGKTRKKQSMKKGTKIRRRSPNGKIERNKQITKKETTKKKKHRL